MIKTTIDHSTHGQGQVQPGGVWRTQGSDQHAYAYAFAQWFGLQPQTARLLVTLYRARGLSMTVAQIGNAHEMASGTIHRHVCELRKALESEAIDCIPITGYRLTDEGMAECRAALWQMGEILRRAS